jgi:1,4-alpha-glucan branching enzyme
MPSNLLQRRRSAFVLWRVANTTPPPTLILERVEAGAPLTATGSQEFTMRRVGGFTDLWEIPAQDCALVDGEFYHYWFEVTPPGATRRVRITDPIATMVDWRLIAPPASSVGFDGYPASVVRAQGGRLLPADAGDVIGTFAGAPAPETLPTNNQLVLYELPTAWTRQADAGGRDTGLGSFRDVMALLDANMAGDPFTDSEVTRIGRAYLKELGINGLELLPPADSFYNRQWGYGTTNFLAPDFELGFPRSYAFPTPNRDLVDLVRTCHVQGVRFFVDVVMAFTKNHPYLAAAPDDFFIFDPQATPLDPDAHNSRGLGDDNFRNGFGSTLFRYARFVEGYDPVSGENRAHLSPARQLMLTSLIRWIEDFNVDGIRLDSVENIQNWDFLQDFTKTARALNRARFTGSGADERFLVVGEELTEPLGLIDPDMTKRRLDGLWHEKFKSYIRAALVGRHHRDEATFEATVRKVMDCRAFGYGDLTEAVIYLTSHDVEGFENERLFNFLLANGVVDGEKRMKLAFACLLTAVGLPMILAGDEFADQHDLFDARGNVTQAGGKQVDPVNFTRLGEDWRERLRTYVARLIRLRTSYSALAVNDIDFLHVDFTDGKRVLAWRRGSPRSQAQVVVLANFSDFGTPNALSDPGAEYVVPNWPAAPSGKRWREIPQDREAGRAGREPIFPWEAKVYALV